MAKRKKIRSKSHWASGSTKWQRFIKKHKGKGYSMQQLSRMYRKQNRKGVGVNVSSWQAFIKEHKGQGYSLKELARMYKEEKRKGYTMLDNPSTETIGTLIIAGLIGYAIGKKR